MRGPKDLSNVNQRRVGRPSKEILEQEIQTTTWVALGEQYGVSDNSVRNWAKQYHLL